MPWSWSVSSQPQAAHTGAPSPGPENSTQGSNDPLTSSYTSIVCMAEP